MLCDLSPFKYRVTPSLPSSLPPFLRPCVHAHPYALKRCSGFYFLAFFRRRRRVVANRVRRGAETEKVINVRGGETHLLPQGAAGKDGGAEPEVGTARHEGGVG